MLRLRTTYEQLGAAGRLNQVRADEIVEAAQPRALAALGRAGEAPSSLSVSAVPVAPSEARGGSLIPAWPRRTTDGSVEIEFVEDWGAMLAAWRAGLDASAAEAREIDELLQSGERVWIGIANDVLQLYVPDPPAGTYSMVRHHALMLAAATSWLGPDRTGRWRMAHTRAAVSFLRRIGDQPVWDAIQEAERGLEWLLAAREAHADAGVVVDWLDAEDAPRHLFVNYLGAASLGLAALLTEHASEADVGWVEQAVRQEHPQADFNRLPVERFVRSFLASQQARPPAQPSLPDTDSC
jgi:hypothetical protein